MFIGKPRLDESVQNKAATLLVTDGALVALSKADARKVVDYMRPHRVPVGTVLIREGQTGRSDFMALVLGGEVTVENAVAHDGIVVSVLGPGSLIGEMGLIDQSPRSATCTAASATTDDAVRRIDGVEEFQVAVLVEQARFEARGVGGPPGDLAACHEVFPRRRALHQDHIRILGSRGEGLDVGLVRALGWKRTETEEHAPRFARGLRADDCRPGA